MEHRITLQDGGGHIHYFAILPVKACLHLFYCSIPVLNLFVFVLYMSLTVLPEG